MFEPRYTLTDKIVGMLMAIAEVKGVIERAKLLPKQEIRLRRQALIRMTHSSTSIEGNQLNIRQVEAIYARQEVDAPARDIFEVKNYLKALRYIGKMVEQRQPITKKVVLQIHQLVTEHTLPEEQSGHYRRSPVYVVRQRLGFPREIVYTAPEAKRVPQMMDELLLWLRRSEKDKIHPVITAGIAHHEFAAVHPFSDGNGRTARALATLILYERGYDFRRLFALEDYYNKDRPSYYKAINIGKQYDERERDFTHWLEYFVKGLAEEIEKVKEKVVMLSRRKVNRKVQSQVFLDKEQMKVLDFLDQIGKMTVSDVMDVLGCPKRTAQLHLQRLKKLGMIIQIGKGPASAYIFANQ